MNHPTNPDLTAPPGAAAELTEVELDGVTGAAIATTTRIGTTPIRPTNPTTSPSGSPSTGQDVETVRPFQPQTAPH